LVSYLNIGIHFFQPITIRLMRAFMIKDEIKTK
jgi:hypothetical protein